MEYISPTSAEPIFPLSEPWRLTPGNKNAAAAPSAFILKAHSANQQQVRQRGMKARKDRGGADADSWLIKMISAALRNP